MGGLIEGRSWKIETSGPVKVERIIRRKMNHLCEDVVEVLKNSEGEVTDPLCSPENMFQMKVFKVKDRNLRVASHSRTVSVRKPQVCCEHDLDLKKGESYVNATSEKRLKIPKGFATA